MAITAVLLFLACIFHTLSDHVVVLAMETNHLTHRHGRRDLQSSSAISIVSPTDKTTVEKKAMDVVVDCGSSRLRRIEVFLDGKIVALRSRGLLRKLSGTVTISVDLSRATVGLHTLEARGTVGFLGRTVESGDISIIVNSSNGPISPTPKAPNKAPTLSPIRVNQPVPPKPPTRPPTRAPTRIPTTAPTKRPTKPPTRAPTRVPTKAPTKRPTKPPTNRPTKAPTKPPTKRPTKAPTTKEPTRPPTKAPTTAPTKAPTSASSRLQGYPKSIVVNASSVIALTVNLTGLNATGIDSFLVYRVDPVSQVVGNLAIAVLRDVGSGAGNDTIAGDKIYSDTVAIRSTFVGETFGFRAVPVIRNSPVFNSTLTSLNLNTTNSISRNSTNNSTALTNTSLSAGLIDGLVLVVEYSWPVNNSDLNTATGFLGGAIGYACGFNYPYTYITNDGSFYEKRRIVVSLGKAYRDLKWKTSTTITMNADWHELPHRGPASISMWTGHTYDNDYGDCFNKGVTEYDNNFVSFAFDPGVQSGCSSTAIAMANVTSPGQVTFINVTQFR